MCSVPSSLIPHPGMSFPNPVQEPDAFMDYLKAENLFFCLSAFQHYRTKPGEVSDDRLDEADVMTWCREMDSLLVCVNYC